MAEEPAIVKKVASILWNNLRGTELLERIVGNSCHGNRFNTEGYSGIEFWNQFNTNTRTYQYDFWIEPRIVFGDRGTVQMGHAKMYVQPVTPKLYRITNDEAEKVKICKQIWKGVTIDDIKQMTFEWADIYHRGDRWMDTSMQIAMSKFYPAAKNRTIELELLKEHAFFRAYLGENDPENEARRVKTW